MQNAATQKITEIIAENVRELIGPYSQPALQAAAKKTGVAARTIAYMVGGEQNNPRLDTLIKFAEGYRLPVISLLSKGLGRAVAVNDPPITDPKVHTLHAAEPAAAYSSTITQLIAIAQTMTETGQARLLERAEMLAAQYPVPKANHSNS